MHEQGFVRTAVVVATWVLVNACGCTSAGADSTVKAQLATAPSVPPPSMRSSPSRVLVELEAKEYVGTLAEGVHYKFWSFNGTVPGPMIRVRVGDTIELRLKNHRDSVFPHSIDLHAVNGPGGGAAVSLVSPGQEASFAFMALAPGLYIYHCGSPIPNVFAHIANGMFGLILVEPQRGLPPVDREFYVMQSEFFTKASDRANMLEFSLDNGLAELPEYVFFNGSAGALTGEALTAKVGETVRIYFGNMGPTHVSSFHVIGEIFDVVYVEGALDGAVNHNVQTTLVPSGGSAIVEFKVDVPGALQLVDATLSRIAKGAIGNLLVKGEENPSLFKGLTQP